MNEFPKISIITPSYNQGQYLEQTICSILDQNYSNLEYIIIDGGSTDNSIDIIKKYQDRINYWVSEKDKGTYDANNKGLAKVTGDYWCVVNSDDLLLQGTFNKIASLAAAHPEQSWFVGAAYLIDDKNSILGEQIPIKPINVDKFTFLNGCWTSHPAVFLKKDIIKTVGFFEKFHLMDMNYWLRMEAASFQPMVIEEYFASLRMHKDCKSANTIKLQEEFLNVYTDFTKHAGIDTNKAVIDNKRQHIIYLNKLKILNGLVKNNKAAVIKLLFYSLSMSRKLLFERWFWGAIKRLVVGVSADDPLVKYELSEESNANWNN